MRKITAIHEGRGRVKKVNVFLDGKFALSLEPELAAAEGLRVEQDLSHEKVKALSAANNDRRCYNAAVRLLGYRPRSEPELKSRLRRNGFDERCIRNVLEKLKRQRLVDDASFAVFWRENRNSFSPRSRWLIRQELKNKGVAEGIIENVVAEIDDDENAYRAGLKKARGLAGLEYPDFRRRLGDYLRRRGFGYGVIDGAVSRLWREAGNGDADTGE